MTTAIELYETAGKPRRAVVKFSEPVSIYQGGKNKTTDKIEAYLATLPTVTAPRLAYYFNPNARGAYYLPENVTEITPVDLRELWRRARHAAKCIIEDRTHGRELDDAFENGDGNEMCAALMRMSKRSPKLDAWLHQCDYAHLQEQASRFANLTDAKLSEHAEQSRKAGGDYR